MPLEWLFVALVIALAVRVVGVRERQAAVLLAFMISSGALAAFAAQAFQAPPRPAAISRGASGFASSDACRSCHPAEYASWHRSYHRRMTQVATIENAAPALAPGGFVSVEASGRTVTLFRQGPDLNVRMPGGGELGRVAPERYAEAFASAPETTQAVVMLTGSHQQQAFWVRGARQGELVAVPAVYLLDEQRLIPRRDAFLNPPDAAERVVRWNSNCIQCHSVAGQPRHDESRDVFESSAAELGIACEGCHGAAAEHASAMRNPLTRYLAHRSDHAVPKVTNPGRLDSTRASQVCGRCHSYFFPKQENDWWTHGFAESYRPGDDLSRAQLLLSPELLATPGAPELGASAESLFYRDGTIRVGGREYNGLTRSPCFERGQGKRKLSCLSCHSMHQSQPTDQLASERDGNQACTQCHAEQATRLTEHTHHAPDSSGSRCYNCHMPRTTYALLGAIRSHRIDSPAFDARTQDRPNACNLCHLETTEAWAAEHARSWYGDKPAFALNRRAGLDDPRAPSGAVFALAGDAAARAITAAALGRVESGTAGLALRQQLLDELARDDYAAVRHVAQRSLARLKRLDSMPPLADALVSDLKALRDNRPVTIAE